MGAAQVVNTARAVAERRLSSRSERAELLGRLDAIARSLSSDEARAVLYLEGAVDTGGLGVQELADGFPEVVTEAVDCLTHHEGEPQVDVVLRAAQNELAREVLGMRIAYELGADEAPADEHRDVLILSQALLDIVGHGGSTGTIPPGPASVVVGARTFTAYLHPVHGDVVVHAHAEPPTNDPDVWVLVEERHKDALLIALLAEKLAQGPDLRSALVEWLEAKDFPHVVYTPQDDGPGGNVAQAEGR